MRKANDTCDDDRYDTSTINEAKVERGWMNEAMKPRLFISVIKFTFERLVGMVYNVTTAPSVIGLNKIPLPCDWSVCTVKLCSV